MFDPEGTARSFIADMLEVISAKLKNNEEPELEMVIFGRRFEFRCIDKDLINQVKAERSSDKPEATDRDSAINDVCRIWIDYLGFDCDPDFDFKCSKCQRAKAIYSYAARTIEQLEGEYGIDFGDFSDDD